MVHEGDKPLTNQYLESYRQSVRDQGLRHKPNSTTYQSHDHNARMNAVVQDAFLGRGTNSTVLGLLNHMGLRMDEDAPKSISDNVMEMMVLGGIPSLLPVVGCGLVTDDRCSPLPDKGP